MTSNHVQRYTDPERILRKILNAGDSLYIDDDPNDPRPWGCIEGWYVAADTAIGEGTGIKISLLKESPVTAFLERTLEELDITVPPADTYGEGDPYQSYILYKQDFNTLRNRLNEREIFRRVGLNVDSSEHRGLG